MAMPIENMAEYRMASGGRANFNRTMKTNNVCCDLCFFQSPKKKTRKKFNVKNSQKEEVVVVQPQHSFITD
jgi:hypothetical protein